MSSFEGRMKEYPTISLDRFDKDNLHARAYFLSHCHQDHMKGLNYPLLKSKVKMSLTVKLYCSPVTKELLLSNPKYDFWKNHIVALEVENPTQISLVDEKSGEGDDIVVTLLPAGHCPGSVMFLIEGNRGTVLYTGDFRLAKGEAARIGFLHTGGRVKDIQSVYLDTTFFDPLYFHIPSREACLNGIRDLVKHWITLSPYHVVWLKCKAAYGYEYLFTHLSEEFGCLIHVRNIKMFKNLPDILCHVTTDRATQIHACSHARTSDGERFAASRLPCGTTAADGSQLCIISIVPSTLGFGEKTRKTKVIVKIGRSTYRACFSFHSSYSEVKDFLTHIRPVNIYPNVIPVSRTVEDVETLLKPLCRGKSGQEGLVYKPLGTLKRPKIEYTLTDSDSEGELFDKKDLTPWRRKSLCNWRMKSPRPPAQANKAPPRCVQDAVPVLKETYTNCTERYGNGDHDDNSPEEPRRVTYELGPKSNHPSASASPTPGPLLTDESTELANGLARSAETGGSRSPKPFSDSEDDSTHVSSVDPHLGPRH